MKPYLALLIELRDKLVTKGATANRTAVKAVKVAGRMMRFDLSGGKVPMVTTKRLHLKSIVGELLWIIDGDTNNETLAQQGIKIWNEWALEADEHRLSPEEEFRYFSHALAEVLDIRHSEAEDRVLAAKNAGTMQELIDAHGIVPPRRRITRYKGDLGPLYGKQQRNFPAGKFFKGMSFEELVAYIDHMAPDQKEYLEREAKASNGKGIDLSIARDVLTDEIGIDQLSQAIYLLKKFPNSRRNLTTSWNPQVVPTDDMSPQDNVRRGRAALAACHAFFQFVTEELTEDERIDLFRQDMVKLGLVGGEDDFRIGERSADDLRQPNGEPYPTHRLNCMMYQRSCDMFLGVPFNVASYAILTHMVAQTVNMVPGELVWIGGDVHLYANHLDQVNEQLNRKPYPAPTIALNPNINSLFDFTMADITLNDYRAHSPIKGEVAV